MRGRTKRCERTARGQGSGLRRDEAGAWAGMDGGVLDEPGFTGREDGLDGPWRPALVRTLHASSPISALGGAIPPCTRKMVGLPPLWHDRALLSNWGPWSRMEYARHGLRTQSGADHPLIGHHGGSLCPSESKLRGSDTPPHRTEWARAVEVARERAGDAGRLNRRTESRRPRSALPPTMPAIN